jgi:hypothetical protein
MPHCNRLRQLALRNRLVCSHALLFASYFSLGAQRPSKT